MILAPNLAAVLVTLPATVFCSWRVTGIPLSFEMMRGANDIYPPNKYTSSGMNDLIYFAVIDTDLMTSIIRVNIFPGDFVPIGEPARGSMIGSIPAE